MKRRRIALVGTGGRGLAFIEPILTAYRQHNELVGLCDLSPTRLRYYNELIAERWKHPVVPTYHSIEFRKLLTEQRPDTVIVCTTDATHHLFIVQALDAGADVVTEKPMTVDAEKCGEIFEAIKRSGKTVSVAFNYRWGPFRTKLKELLSAGTIGRVHSVNLEYLLDTAHGADYFRRWHSEKSQSGGLLVHKSTHHFDLVNWWLDAVPAEVFALGRLVYYGKENAVARGDEALTQYERYTGSPDAHEDPFRLDLAESESFRRLYLDAEHDSSYVRDRNVFREGIDIYDEMSALVRYRTNEILTYSLVAYSPREGMRVTVNGDRGRIEYHEFIGSHMNRAVPNSEFKHEQHGSAEVEGEWIRVYPHFQSSYLVDVQAMGGAHGGADSVMYEGLFGESRPHDKLGRHAQHEQGAASILTGIAANESITAQKPVSVAQLFDLAPGRQRLNELR